MRTGETVGPYTLIKKLGKGSFGIVWLAERRTPLSTIEVALKFPLDDEIDLSVVKQESDLWARASGHPNVLPIIEANIYDGQVVIVSEYSPEGSLVEWLAQYAGKVPSLQSAGQMMSGILSGLEHLHRRQIIHRDLKPANILLQGSTPRLADFGISRVMKSTSHSMTIAGTPSYMAPETFQGRRNVQTDIWSAGVILYQLVAGYLPFPQMDLTQLMAAIVTGKPEPLPISILAPLQEVVFRSLDKDLSQRYKSASEMKECLQRAMELSVPLEQSDDTIPISQNTRTIIQAFGQKPHFEMAEPDLQSRQAGTSSWRRFDPRHSGSKSKYFIVSFLGLTLVIVLWYSTQSLSQQPIEEHSAVASALEDNAKLEEQLRKSNARTDELNLINAVLVSGLSRVVTLVGQEPAPSASAKVYWAIKDNRWVVSADLPPTPAGKVYQLWLLTSSTKTSAGLLQPDSTGHAFAVIGLPANISEVVAAAITLEPDGGSALPTMPIYALGKV